MADQRRYPAERIGDPGNFVKTNRRKWPFPEQPQTSYRRNTLRMASGAPAGGDAASRLCLRRANARRALTPGGIPKPYTLNRSSILTHLCHANANHRLPALAWLHAGHTSILTATFMITVIATIQCRPGKRASFLAEFNTIVPIVRQEAGCLEYGPTVDADTDLDNQHTDPDRVTIVEKWSSVDALKDHLNAPHMLAYRPRVKELVESSELRVLTAG